MDDNENRSSLVTESAEEEAAPKRRNDRGSPVEDHLGNKYMNIAHMCKAYGLERTLYCKRKNLGWPLEKILTQKKTFVDHKGISYPNLNEMCKAYGIPANRYRHRIDYGYSVEKALTAPLFPSRSIPCQDHLGNQYSSQIEMANAYGLTKNQFLTRKRNGWDLERILTTPVRKRSR